MSMSTHLVNAEDDLKPPASGVYCGTEGSEVVGLDQDVVTVEPSSRPPLLVSSKRPCQNGTDEFRPF